jgi:malonyl-CoA/methylmalonyl-CoA synthetase
MELYAQAARNLTGAVICARCLGDRVAVQVEKSPEAIILYLACLRGGAAYLPLNTGYTLAEMEYFIGDAEPHIVICAPKRQAALGPVAEKLGAAVDTLGVQQDGSMLDLARAQPTEFADIPRAGDDLAAILYTSGTTGRSKGAMLTRRNLAANAEALRQTWRYSAKDVLLHALPIFHTHGLFVATNITLVSGASMILLPKFDTDAIFALMPRATVLMGLPIFYLRSRTSACHRTRQGTCGSSSPARRRFWRKRIANGPRQPGTPSSSATA